MESQSSEDKFTPQQIVFMLTHIIDISYSQFEKDFLPYIDSIDHFYRTLYIYRRNRTFTWERAASIARN